MNKIVKAGLIGCGVLVVGAVTIGRSASEKKKREAAGVSAKTSDTTTVPAAPAVPTKSTKPTKADVANATNPVEVTIAKLIADYNANEVGADAKYRDKVLRVTGIVGAVQKLGDTPVIQFQAGGDQRLQADFANEAGLGALKRSDIVSARCRGAGLYGAFPLIVDCVFEKTLTQAEIDAIPSPGK